MRAAAENAFDQSVSLHAALSECGFLSCCLASSAVEVLLARWALLPFSVWRPHRCTLHAQAQAALRQAEVVRWLASAPAPRPRPPSGDPAALLHRLQLGREGAPAHAPARSAHGQQQVPVTSQFPALPIVPCAACENVQEAVRNLVLLLRD